MICADILRRRHWQNLFELANQLVMLVVPVKLPGAKVLDFLRVDAYSPVLVDLDRLKVKPFSADVPDRESLLESVYGEFKDVREFGGIAAFVDAKLADGTLTMHWDVFTDEALPDFTFSEDL